MMTAEPQVNPIEREFCDQCLADGIEHPTIPLGQKFIVVSKGDIDRPQAQIKLCPKHARQFALQLLVEPPKLRSPKVPGPVESDVRGSGTSWCQDGDMKARLIVTLGAICFAIGMAVARFHYHIY